MQFKSKVLPAVEVFEADGTMCLSFHVRGFPSDSEVLTESKVRLALISILVFSVPQEILNFSSYSLD